MILHGGRAPATESAAPAPAASPRAPAGWCRDFRRRPDTSLSLLREKLPELGLRYQLLGLSRNFGSFNAIAAGMEAGRGDFFAVLAADLQEPPQLALDFHDALRQDRADIVFGYRVKRN